MMTKRPSTPESLPSAKRQERTSSPAGSALSLDPEIIEGIIKTVKGMGFTEESFRPSGVFWCICFAMTERDEKPVDEEVFLANTKSDRQRRLLFETWKRGVADDASLADKEALVCHSTFWTKVASEPTRKFGPETDISNVPQQAQEKAIEDSWTATFIGESPLKGLQIHVAEQLSPSLAVYGRYCSIVQSSGMGKSRLLDEFSKYFFLIPVNLRSAGSRGYPPPDHAVRDFLTNKTRNSQSAVNDLMRCFLMALFEKTKEVVQSWMGSSKAERISNFRDYMSKDQSMNSHGNNRYIFYRDVVLYATALTNKNSSPSDGQLASALEALSAKLKDGSDGKSHRIQALDSVASVDIFITFDEAHTLNDSSTYNDSKESRFISLRRVLHALRSEPLFSFFLSTTGKVAQFGPSRSKDESNRINDGILVSPRPYIFVGFDQLMGDYKFREGQTLDYVTSLRFIAHLGRPLWGSCYDHGTEEVRNGLLMFAVQKLLCMTLTTNAPELTEAQKYAVLSQRLALNINTTQYLTSDPVHLMQSLHEQVANHMRVCAGIGNGIETLYAVASSEPILSEAASFVMRTTPFSMPSALAHVLSGFSISQGDRGELLVAALFTCARDLAVHSKSLPPIGQLCHYFSVEQLFSSLFSESQFSSIKKYMPSLYHSETTRVPFGEAFRDSFMHFNHFIKPQEQRLLSRGYLLLYLARGAATLVANCQPGFDAVYPFLHGGKDLSRKRVGFIMVQVKHDSNTSRSTHGVFPSMDPLKCGLIGTSDLEDGHFPIPIIRLLFLLSKGAPSVTCNRYDLPSGGATNLGDDGRPLFTSYDIVCSGLSESVFKPVTDSPDIWAALMNKSQWASLYQGSVPDIVRALLPGCGSNEGHWKPWVEGLTNIINY